MSPAQSNLSHAVCTTVALSVFLCLPMGGLAEQLPVNYSTTSDGLVHNRVLRIVKDSRGFLWFRNTIGNSRCNCHKFVNYSTGTIFENKAGELYTFSSVWRISRFDDKAFTSVRPNVPMTVTDLSWRERSGLIQDHIGEWRTRLEFVLGVPRWSRNQTVMSNAWCYRSDN